MPNLPCTTCDWCESLLPLSRLFNVEYLNENYEFSGFANVLCEKCLDESKKLHGSDFVESWNQKGKLKMNLEKQNKIEELIKLYRPEANLAIQNASFLGMATAMLTNEQADTMISYLEKWIGEKQNG